MQSEHETDENSQALEIVLRDNDEIEELIASVQALGDPARIQKVNIAIGKPSFSDPRLLETIAQWPHLWHLSITSRVDTCLPINLLTNFFLGARNLLTFRMTVCKLSTPSNQQSIEELGEALRAHPSLQVFRLDHCRFEQKDGISLDPLLAALTTIPALQVVSLTPNTQSGLGSISGAALKALCQVPLLNKLSVRYFELGQEHPSIACPAISASATLKELTLGHCTINNGSDDALAKMFQNNTSLEIVTLALRRPRNQQDANNNMEAGCSLVETAKALRSNTTLKQFTLWGKTTQATQQAFLETIRTHNPYLESLWLDENKFQDELFFYTSLNELRRPLFAEGATKMDWVNAISTKWYDLSAIFFLLASNPLLCQQEDGERRHQNDGEMKEQQDQKY